MAGQDRRWFSKIAPPVIVPTCVENYDGQVAGRRVLWWNDRSGIMMRDLRAVSAPHERVVPRTGETRRVVGVLGEEDWYFELFELEAAVPISKRQPRKTRYVDADELYVEVPVDGELVGERQPLDQAGILAPDRAVGLVSNGTAPGPLWPIPVAEHPRVTGQRLCITSKDGDDVEWARAVGEPMVEHTPNLSGGLDELDEPLMVTSVPTLSEHDFYRRWLLLGDLHARLVQTRFAWVV